MHHQHVPVIASRIRISKCTTACQEHHFPRGIPWKGRSEGKIHQKECKAVNIQQRICQRFPLATFRRQRRRRCDRYRSGHTLGRNDDCQLCHSLGFSNNKGGGGGDLSVATPITHISSTSSTAVNHRSHTDLLAALSVSSSCN